jgi:hydroxyethylthiazole kinase-like uncharacterized protein yjeF
MKLFTAQQIRDADAYTIKHEPISSIDLMERASQKCVDWLVNKYNKNFSFSVFCGVGNNGGDGLAISRMLLEKGYQVNCYVVEFSKNYSADFKINLERLQLKTKVNFLSEENENFTIPENTIVIDAIFGSGLSRPAEGFTKNIIQKINSFSNEVVSIDVPSGLFCEDNSLNDKEAIIEADEILSFQFPKLSFLFPENAKWCNSFTVLPIGLHPEFINHTSTNFFYTDYDITRKIYKPRKKFTHKGTYGHALVIAGSYGMAGAAVLIAKGALRAGAGKVTAHIPKKIVEIIQTSLPEAIISIDIHEEYISEIPELENYNAIAVGPGVGINDFTEKSLEKLLQSSKYPIVIDADAISILGKENELLEKLPTECILTPHPKELEKLIGTWENDIEKLEKTKAFSENHQCYIVVKGAHSMCACPSGEVYFNSTGNSGMATAGSGDVLTGIITGLLAQGYSSKESCILGVFLHGLAGDLAVQQIAKESLIASDIIDHLGKAFLELT